MRGILFSSLFGRVFAGSHAWGLGMVDAMGSALKAARCVRGCMLGTLAFCLVGLGAATARGELQTFRFTGNVTSVVDGLGALGPNAGGLSTFSGSYTFDTSTPPIETSELDLGEAIYQFTAPPTGIDVRVGGFEFWTSPVQTDFRIFVRDEFGTPPKDEIVLHSIRSEAAGLFGERPWGVLEVSWRSATVVHDPIEGLELTRIPPSLAELGGGEFLIHGECYVCDVPNPNFLIRGTLTTLTAEGNSQAGDLNGDGRVDAADLALLVGEFGGEATGGGLAADLDGDGRVGLADLMLLRANFSPGDAAAFNEVATSVPEPGVVWILFGAAATWGVRRVTRGVAKRIAKAARRRSPTR